MTAYKESLLVGTIRILANVFMLVALFFAMYQASHSPGSGMIHFCTWFFGLTIPIWIFAFYAIRKVRAQGKSRYTSYVLLPNSEEPCLVEWKVIERVKREDV